MPSEEHYYSNAYLSELNSQTLTEVSLGYKNNGNQNPATCLLARQPLQDLQFETVQGRGGLVKLTVLWRQYRSHCLVSKTHRMLYTKKIHRGGVSLCSPFYCLVKSVTYTYVVFSAHKRIHTTNCEARPIHKYRKVILNNSKYLLNINSLW